MAAVPRRIVAILPAGGVGLRANVPTPKQFWLIGGKPLLYYTLEVFDAAEFIAKTVLVVSKGKLEKASCSTCSVNVNAQPAHHPRF